MRSASRKICLLYLTRFQQLAQAVKQLPEKTEAALLSTVALNNASDLLAGLPSVTKLQQLSGKVQSLVEDIHSEAVDFFTVRTVGVSLSCQNNQSLHSKSCLFK